MASPRLSVPKLGLIVLVLLSGVVLGYLFLDRPYSTFIHAADFRTYPFIDPLTKIKSILLWGAFAGVVLLGLRQLLSTAKLGTLSSRTWLLSLALIVTYALSEQLKYVFGRYWPETWIDKNPSWIGDHAYGFHWFHYGPWYESFPSGHTAVMLCFGTCVWCFFPRLRIVAIVVPALVIAALLLLNYHFISDVLAGGLIGFLVGYLTVLIERRTNKS